MPNIEQAMQNLQQLSAEVEQLFERIEADLKPEIRGNPYPEFRAAKDLLDQAQAASLEVGEMRQRLTTMAAKFYDQEIAKTLGRLTDALRQNRPEAYFLQGTAHNLLDEAKLLGVDMPEEIAQLKDLDDQLLHRPIHALKQ